MDKKQYLACKRDLADIKKLIVKLKELFQAHTKYLVERNRKLNGVDARVTMLEKQVAELQKRVRYLNEQVNKE